MFCTYFIDELSTGKGYIGSHKNHEAVGKTYFSSSTDKEFMQRQKDNPDDYDYLIMGLFDTREEALEHEIELHKAYGVAKNPMFYNLAMATSTGFSFPNSENGKYIRTEEIKKKLSDSKKGSKTKRVICEVCGNSVPINNYYQFHGDKCGIKYNRTFTKEWCENISKGRMGIPAWNKDIPMNEEQKKLISKSCKGRIPHNKGKTGLYKAKRVICEVCNKDVAINIYHQHHGQNCKKKCK